MSAQLEYFFLSKSWQPPLSFTAAAEAWKENQICTNRVCDGQRKEERRDGGFDSESIMVE